MTDEEHLVNTLPEAGEGDESFDVYVPLTHAMDASGATHVAHMRGNEAGFRDVLAGFVAAGSDLSELIRCSTVGSPRIGSMSSASLDPVVLV